MIHTFQKYCSTEYVSEAH